MESFLLYDEYATLVDNLHDPYVLASQQSIKKAALGSEAKLMDWEKLMGLKLWDYYKKRIKLNGSFNDSKKIKINWSLFVFA